MRGALRRKLKDPTITGIIPAYAGSTVSGIAGHPTGWDHPRVCGEHDGRNRSRGDRRGSSPRMRGAHAAHLGRVAWPGIIPAYAGSTTSATTIMPNSGDHPRVCGEHTGHPVGQVGGEGSSPRMRGARQPAPEPVRRPRIIPAYAGSTMSNGIRCKVAGDHPRVCGEHSALDVAADASAGSSPRMRGAHICSRRASRRRRIIPAYAGSTGMAGSPLASHADHPRVCGEHTVHVVQNAFEKGSSPRMRGAPSNWKLVHTSSRIIPAYAGSTLKDPCNPNNMIDKISDF